jgi:hypothetical protein
MLRNAFTILIGKPQEKTLLWRPRRKWEECIKMDFREISCEGMDLTEFTQDTVQ